MFNFKGLVSTILVEQEQEGQLVNDIQVLSQLPGFKKLKETYQKAFNYPPSDNDIYSAISIIPGGRYIAAKYTKIGFLPFIDAFANIFDKIPDKNKRNFKLPELIDIISKTPEYDDVFAQTADRLAQSGIVQVQDYEPTNPDVNRAKQSLMSETNRLSQIAIQSLGTDTIHSAINKMIAKRMPIMDRVVGLKGLIKPYNQSVIKPILFEFKKFTGYKEGMAYKNDGNWKNVINSLWTKKIPGDFEKVVEDITAKNLLNVAVLTYEYYISLLKTQGQPEQQPETVNASLDIFDSFVDSILTEMTGAGFSPSAQQARARQVQQQQIRNRVLNNIARSRTARQGSKYKDPALKQDDPNQQVTGLSKELIEQISNQIGMTPNPDYMSFVDEGTSKYLPDIKYDLATIAKDPTPAAKALYSALTEMSLFIPKKKPGERMKALQGAAQAVWGMSGHSLYGGT